MARKDEKREDRFVWNENDVARYDKNGNRIDPKTGKPVKTENDPYSDEIRRLVKEWQERKKKKNG